LQELFVRYDNASESSIPLDGDRFELGRSEELSLWCPTDFALSRRQFTLQLDGSEWTVEDQNSKNGTFVNGIRLTGKRPLANGDVIVAGHLVLVYRERSGTSLFRTLETPQGSSADKDDSERTVIPSSLPNNTGPCMSATGITLAEFPPTGLGWLVILSGAHAGSRYSLTRDFAIGRHSECDLIVSDSTVSRRHTRIVLDNKRFCLYNTGANGTFLNGIRIDGRQELHDRDEIRVGNTLLRFIQPISSEDMTASGKKRLREFDQVWKELSDAARLDSATRFMEASRRLIADLLCDALGLVTEDDIIPFRNGITGFMVQAPTLRIRKPHFPILVLAYDESVGDLRQAVQAQLARARSTDYFVIFIVVPLREASLDEPEFLREKLMLKYSCLRSSI
jgi:pSer/pThr/pTyr-binding forkhead associated (FHA) protein